MTQKKIIRYIAAILFSFSFTHTAAAIDFKSAPDLKLGDTHSFVKQLQHILNTNGFVITKEAGSPGSQGFETTKFGILTQKALAEFQKKYGINPSTGNFALKTKNKMTDLAKNGSLKEVSSGLSVGFISNACTSASKDGITWTWTPARPCGTYVTGDNWVVGPITVTSISPASVQYPAQPDGVIIVDNGSMLNPNVGNGQNGFTSRGNYNKKTTTAEGNYKSNLNVALQLPLSIPANSSLVSTKTVNPDVNTSWNFPIQMFAILTVVDSAPADGSFRPSPLGSGSRASLWNVSQIDYSKLSSYPKSLLTAKPSITSLAADFSHPWFETDVNWTGGYLRAPYMGGLKSYGQYLAQETADAGLTLNMDYTDAEKRDLLIGMVQVGLDNYGFIQKGGVWYNDGGHNLGRLNPVMIAAAVLQDPNVKSVIQGAALKFQEFQNTFLVSQDDINRRTQTTYTGTNGDINIPYNQSDLGLAEWGVRHTGGPLGWDNKWLPASYRAINGSTFTGTTLLAKILGLEGYINHPALFAYATRFLGIELSGTCLERLSPDDSGACVAYNRTTTFHKQFYALYSGGTLPTPPSSGNDTTPTVPAGGTGSPTTNPSMPTIISPSTLASTTIPTASSVTFSWTSTSTSFMIRFATTTSDGTLLGAVSTDNAYTSTSKSYSVVPGNYYKFWVHAGALSNYSPQDEINIYVSSTVIAPTPTHTLTASKTGTGTGSINGISQAITTLNQGESLTLTAEADANSVFTGWSGDCSGTGSCIISNIQASKNIAANFNSTLTPLFSAGDRVQTIKNVNVRSTPALGGSTNLLGVQGLGSFGTIGSTTPVIADGVVWYNIDYDTGVDGYSGQDNLIKQSGGGSTVVDNDADNDNIDDTIDRCANTPSNLAANVNQYGCPLPIATNIKLLNNIATSDITNISNLEIEDKNGSYGKIKYNQPINMFGTGSKTARLNLDSYITIQNKKVIVDSAAAPQFNRPATITLYGINLSKPLVKKDGEVFATSTSPRIISYDKTTGVLVFQVDGFSTYDIVEDATTYTLNASKTGNGTGSIVGIDSAQTAYTEGTAVTLTALADAGSSFSGWGGDCLGTGACMVTMTGNKTVSASFALNPVAVVPAGSAGGSVGGGSGGGGGGGGSGGGSNAPGAYVNPNNVGLGTTQTTTTATTGARYVFNTDLTLYKRHPDVIKLQQFLNARGYVIAKKGAGSPGLESNYFGPATRTALIKFQIANKIKPAQGYFGKITRAMVNSK